jgi:hypothetical protein
MLYLLSISVTLVGAAILVALILFSHRNEDFEPIELYGGGEREPIGESGDARSAGPPREGGLFETDSHPGGQSEREGESGFSGEKTHTIADGAGAVGADAVGARKPESDMSAAGPAASIPIVRTSAAIPGLGKFELVHFLGKAGFGTLEDERDLEEIHIKGDGPPLELQGEIALTSKHIIVFDAQTAKKIPFGVIEKYFFHDSLLIIKKKNVKKKKTLLKIFGNAVDFQYILGALIPL